MKGKKKIIRVLAMLMFGVGFLSIMEVEAGGFPNVPGLKVLKVSIGFHGDEKAGELFSYEVDPATGCIQNISDKEGEIPVMKEPPSWLVKGKEILYFGNLGDLQCQQGIIGIGSSPIEYGTHTSEGYICIGAWDPCNNKWYPRCIGPYTPCP